MFDIDILGHATAIFYFEEKALISDPHLLDSFHRGLFGYYPERKVLINNLPPIDFILISHAHRDHFDPRSLSLLDRNALVFYPPDSRIERCLDNFGFNNRISVSDWTEIKVGKFTKIIWTPSLAPVTENGFAIKHGEFSFWNIIDTVVDPDIVSTLASRLGGSVDILFAPLQPLLETAINEALIPSIPTSTLVDLYGTIEKLSPKILVPFAEGHHCFGLAEYLNFQRVPFSREQIIREVKSHSSSTLALFPDSGENLEIRDDFGTKSYSLNYVQSVNSTKRYYFPAWNVSSLFSNRADQIDENIFRIFRSIRLQPPVTKYESRKSIKFQKCSYRFLVLDTEGKSFRSFYAKLEEDGQLQFFSNITDVADVETAIPYSDLSAVLKGDLGLATLYLGGRIRDYRRANNWERGSAVFRVASQDISGCEAIVFSGYAVFKELVQRFIDLELLPIEVELGEISDGNWTNHFSNEATTLEDTNGKYSSFGLDAVDEAALNRLENGLNSLKDPGEISGEVGPLYVGYFGRDFWPQPKGPSDKGRLYLHSLVEAQPHLGCGVRFPNACYSRLIENILKSSIEKWEIRCAIPKNISVPAWRLASLFPVQLDRLSSDLKERGWKGQIEFQTSAEDITKVQQRWWLGIPKPDQDHEHLKFVRTPSFREEVPIVVFGKMDCAASSGKLLKDPIPLFRVFIPESAESFFNSYFLGEYRFSVVDSETEFLRMTYLPYTEESLVKIAIELGSRFFGKFPTA